MTKVRTHYDNLQVSWQASPEVIRAAYKSLVQKWHPDKHPQHRQDAERVIRIIGQAYEVLSDPVRRKQHDDWIRGLIGKGKITSEAGAFHPAPSRPYANARLGTHINYLV